MSHASRPRTNRLILEHLEDRRMLTLVFNEYAVNNIGKPAHAMAPVDFDQDGDIDVVTSGVEWYENRGDLAFTVHSIADHGMSERVVPVDFDGDGDLDILTKTYNQNPTFGEVVWFENNGEMQFTRRFISSAPDVPWDVVPADLDNDGDMDVIVGANMDGKLFWIEQTQAGFVEHEIQRNSISPGIRTVFAIDMENDGDVDIVVGDLGGRVAWLENDGSQGFTEHEVAIDDWVE
ncbi:MAG: VCBS repeat-containing protein, partial [Planctomycetota bacterium]